MPRHFHAVALQRFPERLELCVRAIAERAVSGMFAPAPRDGFRFRDLHFLWREARAFVRTVAERLALRATTRTPELAAGLDRLNEGRFLWNERFAHGLKWLRRSGNSRMPCRSPV